MAPYLRDQHFLLDIKYNVFSLYTRFIKKDECQEIQYMYRYCDIWEFIDLEAFPLPMHINYQY